MTTDSLLGRSAEHLGRHPTAITWIVAFAAMACASLLPTGSLGAEPLEPIYVAPTGKDAPGAGTRQAAFGTIQAAMDAAPVGGEVILLPGEYTGPGNENLTFRGKAMTVRSEAGRDATVIRGMFRGDGQPGSRGFVFDSGETALSQLVGVTITGFNAHGEIFLGDPPTSGKSAGIGIRIENASPVIRDCLVSNNYSRVPGSPFPPSEGSVGAGAYIDGGSPSFFDTSIVDNVGAATTSSRTCSSGASAGMSVHDATIHMERCSISRNRAIAGDLSFCGSTFGGVFFSSCTVALIGCTIADNSADQYGGVTFGDSSGCLVNCTVNGNTSVGLRANATSSGHTLHLEHCTLVYNEGSSVSSAAIQISTSVRLTLRNSIVAHNDVNASTQIAYMTSLGHNILSENSLDLPLHTTDQVIAEGVIASTSLPLDNGLAFPLLSGSKALDGGVFIAGITTDQAGSPRACDGDAVPGVLPDIGAFEIQGEECLSGVSPLVDAILVQTSIVGDANLDGVFDGADLVLGPCPTK